MKSSPVIIKLGGSLLSDFLSSRGEGREVGGATPVLPSAPPGYPRKGGGDGTPLVRWLSVIATAQRPAVVVPGGGAFADTVRAEQHRLGFSDDAAHFMAVLAMHQTGTMLIDMQPGRLTAAATEAELRGALGRGEVPVWMALGMAMADPHLPRDWSVTSDGLAAWLAVQLRIPEVWLVKSVGVPRDAALPPLVAEGIVDPVFADIVTRTGLTWRIFGPGAENAMRAELTGQSGTAPNV